MISQAITDKMTHFHCNFDSLCALGVILFFLSKVVHLVDYNTDVEYLKTMKEKQEYCCMTTPSEGYSRFGFKYIPKIIVKIPSKMHLTDSALLLLVSTVPT